MPVLAAAFFFLSTLSPMETPPAVIPLPAQMTRTSGAFTIKPGTTLLVQEGNVEATRIAKLMLPKIESGAGSKLRLAVGSSAPGAIALRIDPAAALGKEGYRLESSTEGVTINGKDAAGLFYGVQTLLQLMDGPVVPAVKVADAPRFQWRGTLLDVARHYQSPEYIKKFIDLLAMHKLNVLHLHLVDDQGWRMEVKRYPKLTEIGAWRLENGKRYGGFYTQAQLRELVQYAAARYVTVMPEIEMPGHCNASLAAYPENSCTGGPFQVPSLWGVMADVYCPGKEQTFTFLQNVLQETLEVFPSTFIHIGGDEVPKVRWESCPNCQRRIKDEGLKDEHELQSYFIKRMDKWLESRGRRLVGWDEILEGGLAPGATVQSWRGMEGAVAAASAGHDVIVSPTSHCYLDYSHAAIPLEKSYAFEPIPMELGPDEAKHVLGGQGNIWGERTPRESDVDRQVWPRMAALAEVFWSPKESRDWYLFQNRLEPHLDRLNELGVRYYLEQPRIRPEDNVFLQTIQVEFVAPRGADAVVYTLDGSAPGMSSRRYSGPIQVSSTTTIKAATLKGSRLSEPIERQVRKVEMKPALTISAAPLSYRYFEGQWTKIDTTDFGTPTATGQVGTIDLTPAKRSDNYALVFEGTFSVPRDGIYTFYLGSDDGSRLKIDDELIIDNDGLHAAEVKRGQVALKAGRHKLDLEYFEAGGDAVLTLDMSGPNLPQQPMPSAWLGK